MENGKIVLEKTNNDTIIAVNATTETVFYLLASVITGLSEKTKISTPDFLSELAISCMALEAAKKAARNNE